MTQNIFQKLAPSLTIFLVILTVFGCTQEMREAEPEVIALPNTTAPDHLPDGNLPAARFSEFLLEASPCGFVDSNEVERIEGEFFLLQAKDGDTLFLADCSFYCGGTGTCGNYLQVALKTNEGTTVHWKQCGYVKRLTDTFHHGVRTFETWHRGYSAGTETAYNIWQDSTIFTTTTLRGDWPISVLNQLPLDTQCLSSAYDCCVIRDIKRHTALNWGPYDSVWIVTSEAPWTFTGYEDNLRRPWWIMDASAGSDHDLLLHIGSADTFAASPQNQDSMPLVTAYEESEWGELTVEYRWEGQAYQRVVTALYDVPSGILIASGLAIPDGNALQFTENLPETIRITGLENQHAEGANGEETMAFCDGRLIYVLRSNRGNWSLCFTREGIPGSWELQTGSKGELIVIIGDTTHIASECW